MKFRSAIASYFLAGLGMAAGSHLAAAFAPDRLLPMGEVVPADWREAQSPDPRGGPNDRALLQTAEFDRSDADFAGMMLRCRDHRVETIFVVVTPFEPRAKAQVAISAPILQANYEAGVIPTGAGLSVPLDMPREVLGRLAALPDLDVTISSAQGAIHGVVSLKGLASPLRELDMACSTGSLESPLSK